MWGAGCIMAEMWTRMAIMQGANELQQIKLISGLCGSFTPDVWPGVQNLEYYSKFELPMGEKRKVKERLKAYVKDSLGCDLIDKLLRLDPKTRYDADAALNHDFFWTDPMPSDLAKMLSHHLKSMFDYFGPQRHQGQRCQPKNQDNNFMDRIY